MVLFWLGVFLVFVGGIANIRGNTSRFNTPSGGGSRIDPMMMVKLNQDVQKVAGTKETTDSYFKTSNAFKPNVLGIIIFLGGVALIVSYFL